MSIPEKQLDTWSHQGAKATSSTTYNAVRNVLTAAGTPYANRDYEVFLQGSYGNDTNIYAESDVDIVIALSDTWYKDISDLPADQQAAYNAWARKATYDYAEFKRDVTKVLVDAYGSDVNSAGDKAIAIAARGNRRKADVIAAVQFRRYIKFKSGDDQLFTPGICFWNMAGERIVNYPKQHSTNLTAKHQASGLWLKPMVRVLKNLRGRLVDDGKLETRIAPSYYLEGLLYNVPTEKFTDSYGQCFVNVVNWFQELTDAQKEQLVCANEQYYLLRDNSHVCWPKTHADKFRPPDTAS